MEWFYFLISVLCLTFAHFFKTLRLKQFIEIYELPNDKVLLQALSLGYVFNFFVPFRLGNLVRAWFAGRKMKNGKSFSLATIIVDIFLDFFAVTIIYGILYLLNIGSLSSLIFYILLSILIIFIMVISAIYNKFTKTIIYKIASIFNNSIELKILKTSWFTITAFKDILSKVKKSKLFLYTFVLWILYLISYHLLTISINMLNTNISIIELFNSFYSLEGMFNTTFTWMFSFKNEIVVLMCIYVTLPLLLIYLFSLIYKGKLKNKKYREILPHVNINDRLVFLEQYFNSDNRDYFKKYIKLNSDVAIIEDYSAGSNATTMLCSKDGKNFYRKYSFGKDAEKLYDQVKWIHEHENKIPLTKIDSEFYEDRCCSYDMPYIQNTVTCFNYVHTNSIKNSWKILKKVLDDISNNLHTINQLVSDEKTIEQYIDSKVLKNISIIENSNYIKPLLKYDYLYINGKKYHNLSYIKKFLGKDKLKNIFKNDVCSDIHGDFTIENIICYSNINDKNGYYIIDPNTGNVHNSPNLDYSKLLQSIHGGYEFLMNTKTIIVKDDHVNFLFTKSSTYNQLFDEYKNYLNKRFDSLTVKSIFYHEIIHWLRLLPYKIEKNEERSVLFYAGMLIVANDVIKWYGEE